MAKATRLKAKAQIDVPQNRGEAAADIRAIGDLQRDLQRATAEMNDKIAVITAEYQPTLESIGTIAHTPSSTATRHIGRLRVMACRSNMPSTSRWRPS